MSEYNIQMNKYNALNAGYDQLYPQPMKHANTHAKDGNDPITPSMIGTYNKTEIDTALQNKADTSSVYNKEESISASTRTALSLPETATPDAALSEIARQLSEPKGIQIDLLWENPSITSTFPPQDISVDLTDIDYIFVNFSRINDIKSDLYTQFISRNCVSKLTTIFASMSGYDNGSYISTRGFSIDFSNNKITFLKAAQNGVENNNRIIPIEVYGIK